MEGSIGFTGFNICPFKEENGQLYQLISFKYKLQDGEPFEIKKAKIRGVESVGMICAEDEIGLGASHDGILVLDEFDKSLQLGFHEQMSFVIGKLSKLNKRVLVSATSGIEIPKYTRVVNPLVLDFIPETKEENNLSLQMVISKERDKLMTLFQLICSLKSEAAIIF